VIAPGGYPGETTVGFLEFPMAFYRQLFRTDGYMLRAMLKEVNALSINSICSMITPVAYLRENKNVTFGLSVQ